MGKTRPGHGAGHQHVGRRPQQYLGEVQDDHEQHRLDDDAGLARDGLGPRVEGPVSIDLDRQRVIRTLTFWLRPEFVLRVVNRFQRVAGFDRSIALASAALTATIPLLIVTSALASTFRAPKRRR